MADQLDRNIKTLKYGLKGGLTFPGKALAYGGQSEQLREILLLNRCARVAWGIYLTVYSIF